MHIENKTALKHNENYSRKAIIWLFKPGCEIAPFGDDTLEQNELIKRRRRQELARRVDVDNLSISITKDITRSVKFEKYFDLDRTYGNVK